MSKSFASRKWWVDAPPFNVGHGQPQPQPRPMTGTYPRTTHAGLNELLDMLTYCRPAGGPTEAAFVARWVETIPGVERDAYGNYHVVIPDATGTAPIVWSCHTDTVHREEGRQNVRYDFDTQQIRLSTRARRRSRCLGADDTAGVFVLQTLAREGVPGHYIFHFAEECGGIGSSDLARHEPARLTPYAAAIALDRRGTGDVITHQAAGRCASDAFAESLASALNAGGRFAYAPAHGIFTDTANYTEQIRECTNLSVGYQHEHTPQETLDAGHLFALLDALRTLDTRALVIARDVDEPWIQGALWPFDDDARPNVDRDGPPIDYDDAGRPIDDADNGHYYASQVGRDEDAWLDDRIYLSRIFADVQRALRRRD